MDTITQEIEQWIAEHGSARDALNVALERLKVSDEDAEKFIDGMWRDIIIAHHPDYGDWEYPVQAHRHLLAEHDDLRQKNAALEAEAGRERALALRDAEKAIKNAIPNEDACSWDFRSGMTLGIQVVNALRTAASQPETEAEALTFENLNESTT